MTVAELILLLPLLVPLLAGTAVMVVGAFVDRPTLFHLMALAGAGGGVLATVAVRGRVPGEVTSLIRVDAYALFYLVLLYAAVGVVAILVRPYLARRRRSVDAFYALLLFAATGMGVLACSVHFASLFLGLELLTLSLYALIGYLVEEGTSLEAALKYLVLAATSSALLLLGIALVYAATGTLKLADAISRVAVLIPSAGADPLAAWAATGAVLLLVGFGFKLALVPFHMWSPDVYQGAPAPATALIATGSKGAVLAVMLRALVPLGLPHSGLAASLIAVAVLTMFAGNLLALFQDDLKRLLAYSSVAHLGYVMVAMVSGGLAGSEAVTFYVLTYVLTTLGAFGVVAALSGLGDEEVDRLADYRGLGRRRPWLAGTLTVMLVSLAGIPPTGGFLAKFAVLAAAVGAGSTGLAVLMALASGLGVYYYLRVVVVMYMQEPAGAGTDAGPVGRLAPGVALSLAVLVVAVIAIGIWPSPWFRAVGEAIAVLYV